MVDFMRCKNIDLLGTYLNESEGEQNSLLQDVIMSIS